MNFKEKISNYFLGNISTSQLPEIGIIGLKENFESESLVILAGMNEKDNSFEIEEYFKRSLIELGVEEPNEFDAAKTLIIYYLKKIISESHDAFKFMAKIDNEIYNKVYRSSIQKKGMKYVGEEFGLENLYTWYRELQDWTVKSRLQYYSELTRTEQKLKFTEHLIEEAKKLHEKLIKDDKNGFKFRHPSNFNKIIDETDKLRLEHEFESTYLVEKSNNQILMDDYFLGNPTCGLIDNDNKWVIVAGTHLTLWTQNSKIQYQTEKFRDIYAIRKVENEKIEILLDPWAEFSAIWELNLINNELNKIDDFIKYKGKEYSEYIEW